MVGVEAKNRKLRQFSGSLKILNRPVLMIRTMHLYSMKVLLVSFAKSIGFKITDKIVALDGKTINIQNIQSFVEYAKSVKEGQNVTVTVLRNNGKNRENRS
jgi:PDZ domain-containing secreted protein